MGESFLIALREGFEAALIVAIVLAFVKRSDSPGEARWVWIGAGAAVAVAVAAGVALQVTLDGLNGVARLRTFAVICFAAAGLLTWMIFWMRSRARSLKGELEGKAAAALHESGWALAAVAFLAVVREGLETALFLVSTTASSDGAQVVIGTLAGLAVASLLGVAVYHGSKKFPMRLFFQVTGVLIIIFAAGLLARGVMFLQAAGDIGTVNGAVYDLTRYSWLTIDTQSGRFLAGIFGWDPRPSLEQAVVWLAFVVPVTIAFFWGGKPGAPAPQAPQAPVVDHTATADGADGAAAPAEPAEPVVTVQP